MVKTSLDICSYITFFLSTTKWFPAWKNKGYQSPKVIFFKIIIIIILSYAIIAFILPCQRLQ